MKIILSILVLATMVFAETKYSVQVLSVKNKDSITKEFMKKVDAVDMPYTNHHIGEWYKVLVGNFDTYTKAKDCLPKLRNKIASDSFITKGMAVLELDPKAKMQQAMLMAKSKSLSPEDIKKVEKTESIEIKAPVVTEVVVVEKVEFTKELTKKDIRRSEIAEAIAFYKNSPFHSFN